MYKNWFCILECKCTPCQVPQPTQVGESDQCTLVTLVTEKTAVRVLSLLFFSSSIFFIFLFFLLAVNLLAYLREMANAQSINLVCAISVKLALVVEVVHQKGPSRPLFLVEKSFVGARTWDSHISPSLVCCGFDCKDSPRIFRQCWKEN